MSRPVRRSRIGDARSALLLCFVCVLLAAGRPTPAGAEPLILDVVHADPLLDERTKEPVVSFRLMPSSKRKLGEFTTANVGRKVEIRVDGQVLMSPVIREPIINGVVQVSGHFILDEAADLAARLTAGTSKIEVELVAD